MSAVDPTPVVTLPCSADGEVVVTEEMILEGLDVLKTHDHGIDADPDEYIPEIFRAMVRAAARTRARRA